MKFRNLRIAWSVMCGILCLMLIALWVRSYWQWDNVGTNKTPSLYHVVSLDGRAILLNELFIPTGSDTGDRRSWFYLTQESGPMPPYSFPSYLGFYVKLGKSQWIIALPYCFLAAAAIAMAAFPWARWHLTFSLRTLLLTVTFLALALGTIVWLTHA
jgi:hypothetical protein